MRLNSKDGFLRECDEVCRRDSGRRSKTYIVAE